MSEVKLHEVSLREEIKDKIVPPRTLKVENIVDVGRDRTGERASKTLEVAGIDEKCQFNKKRWTLRCKVCGATFSCFTAQLMKGNLRCINKCEEV